jgi:hypothetical protein
MKKKKPVEISIVNFPGGFSLLVGSMVVRTYSRRGELKAIQDARMIVYALQAVGIEWITDLDLSPL